MKPVLSAVPETCSGRRTSGPPPAGPLLEVLDPAVVRSDADTDSLLILTGATL